MHTPNKADENFKKLATLFPNAVTETIDENGVVVRAIDKDVLMQEISTTVVEGKDERYQFTWPDKKKSVLLANAPIAKTLRPCPEESVGKDGTPGGFDSENLYIEGDNLEVLKLLQETYLGKVKMIYIDPPYNTGNDFVYEDDFAQSTEEYLANSGQFDEEGNRLVENTESNGRFHTDWLNMIYPRLKLAKDLLAEDGVIFISIDDNELDNLRKVCDEVFGASNFFACVNWHKNYASANDSKTFSRVIDYILVYRKSNLFERNLLPRTEKQNVLYKYDSCDGKGRWRSDNLSVRTYSASYDYPITNPNTGTVYNPPSGRCWITNQETMKKWIEEGRVFFGQKGDGAPQLKRYLSEVQAGVVPTTYWNYEECGHNDEARKEIKELFGKPPFDSPKPTRLLKQIITIATQKDTENIILDFFSGSATTAHAVMQLNAEDGGNRKFIMVQLPEATDEKSETYKAGYKNICEIGKERIRRAGAKIRINSQCTIHNAQLTGDDSQLTMDNAQSTLKNNSELRIKNYELDTGFRVLKCDSSNMKDVYYTPNEYNPSMFDMLADNIKEDRTPQDLLFQVMLDMGVLLSSKIEETEIAGKKVFNVGDDFLIACFDNDVTEETITAIAKQKPYYFVMRDSSLASDSVAANFEQIFATYSPDTIRKVL